jgi:hypothetical protein
MIWKPVLMGVYEVSDSGQVRRRMAPRAGRLLSRSGSGRGIAKTTAHQIVTRKSWRHIP